MNLLVAISYRQMIIARIIFDGDMAVSWKGLLGYFESRRAITSFKDQTLAPMPPSTMMFLPTSVALHHTCISATSI